MTIRIANARRLRALRSLEADKVLIKPARHKSDLVRSKEGTVGAYLFDALAKGPTLEQIQLETMWTKSTAMAYLYRMAKRSGVGILRQSGRYFMILPGEPCEAGYRGEAEMPKLVLGTTGDPAKRNSASWS